MSQTSERVDQLIMGIQDRFGLSIEEIALSLSWWRPCLVRAVVHGGAGLVAYKEGLEELFETGAIRPERRVGRGQETGSGGELVLGVDRSASYAENGDRIFSFGAKTRGVAARQRCFEQLLEEVRRVAENPRCQDKKLTFRLYLSRGDEVQLRTRLGYRASVLLGTVQSDFAGSMGDFLTDQVEKLNRYVLTRDAIITGVQMNVTTM